MKAHDEGRLPIRVVKQEGKVQPDAIALAVPERRVAIRRRAAMR
ncbi:MAG: hypothetical protein ABFC67_07385 [Mizugakiibacter sp.]